MRDRCRNVSVRAREWNEGKYEKHKNPFGAEAKKAFLVLNVTLNVEDIKISPCVVTFFLRIKS